MIWVIAYYVWLTYCFHMQMMVPIKESPSYEAYIANRVRIPWHFSLWQILHQKRMFRWLVASLKTKLSEHWLGRWCNQCEIVLWHFLQRGPNQRKITSQLLFRELKVRLVAGLPLPSHKKILILFLEITHFNFRVCWIKDHPGVVFIIQLCKDVKYCLKVSSPRARNKGREYQDFSYHVDSPQLYHPSYDTNQLLIVVCFLRV